MKKIPSFLSPVYTGKTLSDLFFEAGDRWGAHPAFATRTKEGSFEAVSYETWKERSLALATALIELGVEARSHVGLLSDNCFEWILVDAAVQFCGAADVPRGSDVTESEIAYIMDHADVRILFLENETLLQKFFIAKKELPQVKHVILMKDDQKELLPEGVITLASLEERGKILRDLGNRSVEERMEQVRPEDLFTLIYTSGTTGTPKGVQLTHASMSSQVEHLGKVLKSEFACGAERALSLLPIWHSYERVFEMLLIHEGGTLYYTSLRHLGNDLKKVRPTIMASSPRLWEALYEKIMTEIAKQRGLRQLCLKVALEAARWVRSAERFFTQQQLDLVGRSSISSVQLGGRHALQWIVGILPFLVADATLLKRLRQIVGGKLKATISGGGALPPHIDAFFNDLGIALLEGYGLTESGPVIAVRTSKQGVIGTVGPLLPETEIAIIDLETGNKLYPDPMIPHLGRGRRGEIIARGPQMMKGYYKDPEGSAKALRDGWLHTGDIGIMTFNQCLKIVGRSKETIVLLNGENVEPLPIESRLLESPFIAQCMVVGQDQKQLGLLVVPSLPALVDFFGSAAAKGRVASDLASLSASSRLQGSTSTASIDLEGGLLEQVEVQQLFQSEIRRLVSTSHGFKAFEKIGCWRLLSKPFEVGQELTATYKLKRHFITEQYDSVIREMF